MNDLALWFEHPWLLPLAVILPLLAVITVRRSHARRRERLTRFGDLSVVSRLVPPSTLAPPTWRAIRLGLAALLAGIAIAGPRWGASRSIVRARGIDLVLSLDASSSMLAADDQPSRLDRLKQEVRRLRALSSGDRIGVLAFAGRSYVLSPLTIDAGALDLFLDNLDPSVVGQAGSSLARTIRQGTDLLALSQGGADKALVVMSDGESFEPIEEIIAEARHAAEQGVSLVTVGFGTQQGATIPVRDGDVVTEKRDETGAIVISRYDPRTLRAAAEAAGGTFIPAEATDKAARIRQALARLRTQARAIASTETRVPRYQWFLAPAVLLLLADTLLSERRGRRRHAAAATETAMAAMLLLTVALGACNRSSAATQAVEAYRAKRYPDAVAGFKQAIDAGDRSVATIYNLGTALIAADSLERAIEALERTTKANDAEVRFRSLFNLGYAHLVRGLAAGDSGGTESLDAALATYKRALLQRPRDLDAKWNYELALRKKDEQSGGGGGGGGGGESQSQGESKEQQGEDKQPAGGLGQRQAEQLLGSAAREERDVQAKKQGQNRVEPPPGGKDW